VREDPEGSEQSIFTDASQEWSGGGGRLESDPGSLSHHGGAQSREPGPSRGKGAPRKRAMIRPIPQNLAGKRYPF